METIPIRFYNTASRKKETFKPLHVGCVEMYSCGPTVYESAHLGHYRAYIFVDTLKRVLSFNGLKVRSVMNITNVGHLTSDADVGEDKVEKAAREKQMSAWDIAEYYTKDFFDAMQKLNVERPDIVCRATDHIEQMIELVQKLEEKGYTYRTSDGIYFDTSKFAGYPDFARLNLQHLKEGARVEPNPEKRKPSDFALWKFSPAGTKRNMEWDSPWGVGFPGWHIECSAMSMHYLGETFDIHTGGIDHITVHHTNEIAQSEAATGKKFVRYWLHNEFLMVNGEKMSKSKHNFYTLVDIEAKGFNPLALRYLFLTAHYRSKINFTWKSLEAAEHALNILREHIIELKGSKNKESEGREKVESYRTKFLEAINDDINTPAALSTLWELVHEKDVDNRSKLELLLKFDEVLGLGLKDVKQKEEQELNDEIRGLIKNREELRRQGKYSETDEIRKRLDKEFNITVEDTPEGTKWRFKVRKN